MFFIMNIIIRNRAGILTNIIIVFCVWIIYCMITTQTYIFSYVFFSIHIQHFIVFFVFLNMYLPRMQKMSPDTNLWGLFTYLYSFFLNTCKKDQTKMQYTIFAFKRCWLTFLTIFIFEYATKIVVLSKILQYLEMQLKIKDY